MAFSFQFCLIRFRFRFVRSRRERSEQNTHTHTHEAHERAISMRISVKVERVRCAEPKHNGGTGAERKNQQTQPTNHSPSSAIDRDRCSGRLLNRTGARRAFARRNWRGLGIRFSASLPGAATEPDPNVIITAVFILYLVLSGAERF